MIGLQHYLVVAAALFVIGIFLNPKNMMLQMWRDPAKALELVDLKLWKGL